MPIGCADIQKERRSQAFTPNSFLLRVGVTGFEPATTRPPDAYSNRAELHPESCFGCKSTFLCGFAQVFFRFSDFFLRKTLDKKLQKIGNQTNWKSNCLRAKLACATRMVIGSPKRY